MIKVIIIPNMLKPKEREEYLSPFASERLVDYFDPDVFYPAKARVISSHKGELCPDEIAEGLVVDGEEIIVTPVVEDPVTGGIMIGSFLLTYGAMAQIALAMLMMGLNLLMAKKNKPSLGGGGGENSPTYGWSGIQTMSDVDIPIPIIYGQHAVGGNIINTYIESNGSENNYLYMLVALGEGPITSIGGLTEDTDNMTDEEALDALGDGIHLNENPIGNYGGVEVSCRMGSCNQTPIEGFDEIHRTTTYQDERLESGTEHIHTTSETADCEKVRIQFRIPQCYATGVKPKKERIRVQIWYRPWTIDNSEEWILHDTFNKKILVLNSPWYYVREIDGLTPGRYDVKLVKTSGDSNEKKFREVYWDWMDEVKKQNHAYPFTALLGLKIKATDQLSGSPPKVKTIVKGRTIEAPDIRKNGVAIDSDVLLYDFDAQRYVEASTGQFCDVWDGETIREQYSANPFWCMRDFLQSTRYGLGGHIDQEHVILSDFIEGSFYCDEGVEKIERSRLITEETTDGDGNDQTNETIAPETTAIEKRFRLDIVADSQERAFDWIVQTCSTFRTIPMWANGKVVLIVDKPEAPTQLFTMGNIIKDSFSLAFTSRRQAHNQYELQFSNAENLYERDSVIVADSEALANSLPIVRGSSSLMGVTRRSQAVRIGQYMINCEKHCIRTIKFRAFISAIASRPGDVIAFAHDVPAYGLKSGRIRSAMANSFTIYSHVTFEAGKEYSVLVQHADDTLEELTILSPAGTYSAGSSITVDGPWTQTPSEYDTYSIGEVESTHAQYRIMGMRREEGGEVEISAIQYVPEIYDADGVIVDVPNPTNLPNPTKLPRQVQNLTAINTGGHTGSVIINWTPPTYDADYGWWDHAEIYLSEDAESWNQIGTSAGSSYEIQGLIPGSLYNVKVCSISRNGMRASFDRAPTVQFIVALGELPPDVRGLELEGQGNDTEFVGKDPVFAWLESSTQLALDDYGVDEEPLGMGQGVRDTTFQDYKVSIYIGGELKRTEYVTEARYTYTYEKNTIDNGTPSRDIEIRVWARDNYNQESANAAILEVSNPVAPAPNALTIVTSFETYFISWDAVNELDLSGYEVRRGSASDFAWEDGETVFDGAARSCTDKKQGSEATQYYRVGAYDSFGKVGMQYTAVQSGIAGTISMSDTDFEADLSNMYTNIPVPENHAWTDNSPAAGQVSWPTHKLYFRGVEYTIAGAYTTHPLIVWELGNSAYTFYMDDPAGLGDTAFIMATNVSGVHSVQIGSIANQIIGSAFIRDAAINSAKIANLAVDTAHIADAAITNAKIDSLEAGKVVVSGGTTLADWRDGTDATKIDGGSISANSISANQLKVGNRGVIFADIKYSTNAVTNVVSWTSGSVEYIDNDGSTATASITAGNANWSSGVLYLYWVRGATTISNTTDRATAFGAENVVVGAYLGGSNLNLGAGQVIIDETGISVDQLSAITANMGSVTSGSITLTIPSTTNKLRIDDSGIYVSHDSGSTWRKFLAVDDSGLLVVSFDAFDEDTEIPGIFIANSLVEVSIMNYKFRAGDTPDYDQWSDYRKTSWTTRDETEETALVDIYTPLDDGPPTIYYYQGESVIQFQLYDENDVAVWTSEEFTFDNPSEDTMYASNIFIPVSEYIDMGEQYKIGVRSKNTDDLWSNWGVNVKFTSLDTDELFTFTDVFSDGNWSGWDYSILMSYMDRRERVYITAESTAKLGTVTSWEIEFGVFDSAEVLKDSVTFIKSGDSLGGIVYRGAILVRDLLNIGDTYKLGVRSRVLGSGEGTIDATVYKSKKTSTSGIRRG